MAHPSRRNRKKSNKSAGVNKNNAVRKGQIGTNAIAATQKWAMSLKPYELQYPTNLRTFHEMFTKDEAVGGVLNATYALVENAFKDWSLKVNKSNPESVRVAEFLDYNLNNLADCQTMCSFARDAATFNQFGFSIVEKDYRKENGTDGGYTGKLPKGVDAETMYTVDRLRFIPQRSLSTSEPFIIGNEGRDILACQQDSSWFTNSSQALASWNPIVNTVQIRRNKFMLMGINVTDSNPMGVSPLEQVYVYWKEKKFCESYQSVGISKDMAGMPLLEIPSDILNKANNDPSSAEGQLVTEMVRDVCSMHAGEQNMMVLPSDTDNSGKKDYALNFLGVTGTGKQFDLQEIINKRREAIYSTFGALNLISSERGGSYNLIEGQSNIHLFFIKHVIGIIENAINKDLIPQILKLNNIKLPQKDIPVFRAGNVAPVSLEEKGKYINRVARLLPAIPEVQNVLLQDIGIDFRVQEKNTYKEEDYDVVRESLFDFVEPSKVGSGEGSSGTGGKTQDNSDTNSENAA